jgi:hypothetical protein
MSGSGLIWCQDRGKAMKVYICYDEHGNELWRYDTDDIKISDRICMDVITEMIDALENAAEQLEYALQKLGVCGHGDGGDRKGSVDDYGGYEALEKARKVINKGK